MTEVRVFAVILSGGCRSEESHATNTLLYLLVRLDTRRSAAGSSAYRCAGCSISDDFVRAKLVEFGALDPQKAPVNALVVMTHRD